MLIDISAPICDLPVQDLASYLQVQGWELAHQNRRWLIFHGRKSASGDPFEIILPRDIEEYDYRLYIGQAVKILSSLNKQTPATTVNEILLYDRDVLKIRVCDTAIDYISKQTPRIKSLIRHSANSERNLKPHFDPSYYSKAATEMVDHFRLLQTINGETSYHVESRVGEKETFQRLLPLNDRPDPGDKLPLERRVMERIATGLVTLDQVARTGDVQSIIDGYTDGFNANMCDAILALSKYSSAPIRYSVKWSKKIDASVGVKVVRNVEIARRHCEYLKSASDKLKELKPEFQLIRGRVIGLSSLGDPQSEEVDKRSVVVLWEHGRGRPRKLHINLDRSDYMNAIKAHKEWASIAVEGTTLKRRSGWELADPHNFKTVN